MASVPKIDSVAVIGVHKLWKPVWFVPKTTYRWETLDIYEQGRLMRTHRTNFPSDIFRWEAKETFGIKACHFCLTENKHTC